MAYASTTIQVSEGVRKNLAEIAAQRQTELGRSGRVPYSEVIEYLIEQYKRAQRPPGLAGAMDILTPPEKDSQP